MGKSNKEKTLKILEEHYKAIKEQDNPRDFFLNTADFVKFVQGNQGLMDSIKKLEEQQKRAYKAFQQIDIRAVKEAEEAAKKVIDIVNKAHIDLEPVRRVIEEMNRYNLGEILSSASKVHQLNRYLTDVAHTLKASGFERLVEQFRDENKRIKNIYGNFTFSPTLPKRDEAEAMLNRKRETEVWGAWEDLPSVARIFSDDIDVEEEIENIPHKDKLKKWAMMKELVVQDEARRMLGDPHSGDEYYFFKVSDFKKKVDRIFKYLLIELLSEEAESEDEQNAHFDLEKATLFIGTTAVKLKKFSDQYDLIRIIFEDQSESAKEWFFSEIAEIYDPELNMGDKKFYNAAYQVNQKIIKATGISDFFTTTSQSLKINPKYLS